MCIKRLLLWAEHASNTGMVGMWGKGLDLLYSPASLLYIGCPWLLFFVGVCFSLIKLGRKYGWKNSMPLLLKVTMAKLSLAKQLAINLKYKWIEYRKEKKKSLLEVRRKEKHPGCLWNSQRWSSVEICLVYFNYVSVNLNSVGHSPSPAQLCWLTKFKARV